MRPGVQYRPKKYLRLTNQRHTSETAAPGGEGFSLIWAQRSRGHTSVARMSSKWFGPFK